MDHDEPDIGNDWDDEDPEIERGTVALRAVLSVLFALVISVLNSLLAVLVIFQLAYTLVTQHLPGARVQVLGNRVTAFYYQVLRYLTHDDSRIPFPFSDFPTPLETGRPAYAPASADPEDDDGLGT